MLGVHLISREFVNGIGFEEMFARLPLGMVGLLESEVEAKLACVVVRLPGFSAGLEFCTSRAIIAVTKSPNVILGNPDVDAPCISFIQISLGLLGATVGR